MRTTRLHPVWRPLGIAAKYVPLTFVLRMFAPLVFAPLVFAPLVGMTDMADAATLTVMVPTGSTGTQSFVVFYANVTIGANTVGEWFETPSPVTTGTPPQFTITDTSGGNFTLSNAQFFLSPTLIPLDQLNQTDLPPSNSQFSPLPSQYDIPLTANSSVTVGSSESGSPVNLVPGTSPLPSTWITLLTGLAGLGFVAYRRQRQSTSLAAA